MKCLKQSVQLAACAVAAACAPIAVSAADRVALIIGNGAYQAAPTSTLSVVDSADLADAFGAIGFEVTHLPDADGRAMRSAVRAFEYEAEDASVAVIYFSGHAIAGDGVNYLLPVDVRLERDSHVDDEGVPLSRFVVALSGASDLRIVVVDTTAMPQPRLALKSALGKRRIDHALVPVDLGVEAVVALAAAANDEVAGTERNGPYAAALLAHLETPSLGHQALFERAHRTVADATTGSVVPLMFGMIGDTVPLVPDSEVLAALGRGDPVEAARPNADETAAAFRRAEGLGTVAAWDNFLQFCPTDGTGGVFCAAAATTRQKILDSGVQSGQALAIVGDGSGVLGGMSIVDLSAAVADETPAATCDRLASHTYDADKPEDVAGTTLAMLGVVSETAIAACTEAVEADPDQRRFAFALGRTFHAADRFDEAMTWYARAAEAGSSIAMSNIGFLHASGSGVPQDYDAAHDWYERGAEAGNVAAMNNLAELYYNGSGVRPDSNEARHWYGEAAAGGNVVAMNTLALLYQNGAGGPQDLDKARTLFEAAAELGLPEAINNLGQLYNYGRGVPIDHVQARQHYEAAAALGNGAAMVNLGLLYERAQGVREDYRKAREWYEKAAVFEDAAAMNNLGILYQYGRGTREDLQAARQWYEKAASLGDPAAMTNLAYLYDGGRGVPLDKVKAREWYLKGAEGGNGPAMASIGYLYANGEGGPRDFDAALKWYRRGADIGNAAAAANLGFMYEQGWGVEPDLAEALSWYERSGDAGNAVAMANVGLMYEHGRGVAVDRQAALEWYRRAAEAGNVQGMVSLAFFYSNATDDEELDLAAALEWYTRAVNLGDTIAMHNLGIAYKDGLGTEPNLRRATDLFILSMRSGNGWTFDQFRDHYDGYPSEILAGIERYLIEAGFLDGEPDGVVDEQTRAALDALQAAVSP